MSPTVESRVWKVSRDLRKRAGWRLTSASIQRSWPNGIDAVVSMFLETSRGAGVVIAVLAPSNKRTRTHFRELHARLGTDYRFEDARKKLRATRVMRGTTEPTVIVSELRRVAAAIAGKRVRGPESFDARTKPPNDQSRDAWKILATARASGWLVSSVHQDMDREARRQGTRWTVHAGFGVLGGGREIGIVGSLAAWEVEGRGRSNPLTGATPLLERAGYRKLEDWYFDHWRPGLAARTVNREIRLLEKALALVSSVDARGIAAASAARFEGREPHLAIAYAGVQRARSRSVGVSRRAPR